MVYSRFYIFRQQWSFSREKLLKSSFIKPCNQLGVIILVKYPFILALLQIIGILVI